jgi:fused signal recognition particle receptor
VKVWADRAGVPCVAHQPGGDAGAVAFDAVQAATGRGLDFVLIDTAGRLQTAKGLMQELGKVARVVGKAVLGAPHETLLVLDATGGQNAIAQAEAFAQATPLTGLVLTKLDGTARGGIALAVEERFKVPVKWVGVGEGVGDLAPFDPAKFVEGILGTDTA